MWPASKKILDLNGVDYLTIGDCFQNFFCPGDPAAGKTSAVLHNCARAFLGNDFGAVFLCVKSTAAADYLRWSEEADRDSDTCVFKVGGQHSFNFLDFLANRAADKVRGVEDLVHVLVDTMEVVERQRATAHDPFFRPWSLELLKASVRILLYVFDSVQLPQIAEFLSSLPRDPKDVRDSKAFCSAVLQKALRKAENTPQADEIDRLIRFFGIDWVNWAEETRESIRASAQILVMEISSEPLASLFGRATTVSPADILNGKIVIVDIPVNVSERTGKIANTIWRTSVQRALLARPVPPKNQIDSMRPVLICGDEAHLLATLGDELFVSTSREFRGITFYATQNINGLVNVLGKPATMALLGSLLNVFITRCNDTDTAQWFRALVNSRIAFGQAIGPESWTVFDFNIDAIRSLKKGGPGGKAEALFARANDTFKVNGLRWCRLTFRQNDLVPKSAFIRLVRRFTGNDVRVLEDGK